MRAMAGNRFDVIFVNHHLDGKSPVRLQTRPVFDLSAGDPTKMSIHLVGGDLQLVAVWVGKVIGVANKEPAREG